MRTALCALLFAAAASTVACAGPVPAPRPAATLQPYPDEAHLEHDLDHWQRRARQAAERRRVAMKAAQPVMAPPPQMAAPMEAATTLDSINVAGAPIAAADESITNNQVQGVDEGDIVKRAGDVLVVLRRGRLFTVRIGGDALAPVASLDAFGPDVDPSGTWYDEMLVSDGAIAVIGYSYSRGGTEVGLFDLSREGALRYRGTYQLRSNDYYSSRNYASRLVGHRLVFYTPEDLVGFSGTDWSASMPAYRRWSGDAASASFRRMLPATRVYRGLRELPDRLTLHTVSVCDLDAPAMTCEATAVLGGAGGVFHVSQDAVYVWTTGERNARGTTTAAVLRLPLDGGAPSMLRTWGSPIDQMGFLQKDGWLNVLVAREGDGDRMWRANGASGDVALMRVPLSAFGGLDAQAPRDAFRLLPGVRGYAWQQRFIGDWLVYGDGMAEGRPVAHALRYAMQDPVQTFTLPHALERIDALGTDGVLVGGDGNDLVFTGLRLRGDRAALAGGYRQRDAQQGDERTHGFFYRAQDADQGVLGLPILRGGEHAGASVLYLRNRALALSPLGMLDSHGGENDDHCRASCVDWYGNARPVFIGDRVFALMGYEIIEGRLDAGAIRERRRVDFAPRALIAD